MTVEGGQDRFELFIVGVRARVSPERVVVCFQRYLENEGKRIGRGGLENNLCDEARDGTFRSDVASVVAPDVVESVAGDIEYFRREILPFLPNEPVEGER